MITILLFAGVVLIQSATRPVVDFDEMVYLHLSQGMTWTGGNYTTRGTPLSQQLPQPVYRSAVFHHPPLIPFIMKVFSLLLPPLGAARLMNAVFYGLLLWLVFAVAQRLSDGLGGVIAMTLASICPVINVEARLVHIDLGMTVFILLGTYLCLPVGAVPPSPWRLAAAGTMFAAGFLSRFTGPVFLPIPVMLFAWTRERGRRVAPALSFFGTLALGFLWWGYIFGRFGSLVPEGFKLSGFAPFNPYLRSLAQRHWYHLLLYFLALCPLAAVYVGELIASSGRLIKRGRESDEGTLVVLNIAAWISAVVFGFLVATGSAYWVLRFFLPLVAIIYISLGCMLSRILRRGLSVWNSYLLALTMFTGLVMIWSTATSINLVDNLEPIPVALFWFGLGRLFH